MGDILKEFKKERNQRGIDTPIGKIGIPNPKIRMGSPALKKFNQPKLGIPDEPKLMKFK